LIALAVFLSALQVDIKTALKFLYNIMFLMSI